MLCTFMRTTSLILKFWSQTDLCSNLSSVIYYVTVKLFSFAHLYLNIMNKCIFFQFALLNVAFIRNSTLPGLKIRGGIGLCKRKFQKYAQL